MSTERIRSEFFGGYGDGKPLGGYAALIGLFSALLRLFCSLVACVTASHLLHHSYAMLKEGQRQQELRASPEQNANESHGTQP